MTSVQYVFCAGSAAESSQLYHRASFQTKQKINSTDCRFAAVNKSPNSIGDPVHLMIKFGKLKLTVCLTKKRKRRRRLIPGGAFWKR
jgi:hypothetical protein